MSTALMTRRPALVTAHDAVHYLSKALKVEVKPATLRQWAARGHIGTPGRGRKRYDLWEVVDYVKRQRPNPDRKRGNDDGEAGH